MKWKLLLISMFSFSTYVFPMHVNIPDYAEEMLQVISRIPTQEGCENYLLAIKQHPIVSQCPILSPECAEYYSWMAEYGIKQIPNIIQRAAQRYSVIDLQKILHANWEYYIQICQSKSEDTPLIDTDCSSQDAMTSNVPMIVGGIGLAVAVYYVGIPWMKKKLMHLKVA